MSDAETREMHAPVLENPRVRAGWRVHLSHLSVGVALALVAACTSSNSNPVPGDAAGQLMDAAAHLDGTVTFRLTMHTDVPATTASASASPKVSTSPATPSTINLSGVWDTATHTARMDGSINGVATTVLSADGVEYVSLTPGAVTASGKKWLKVDNSNATFGAFYDPMLVSQLLRAYHAVTLTAPHHLTGTIVTSEADRHIADPNLIASLSGYPATLGFDITTDGAGAPTSVILRLAGDPKAASGTVQLGDFGTRPATVVIPTANEIVQAPPAGSTG
jgi:hypothetical protein